MIRQIFSDKLPARLHHAAHVAVLTGAGGLWRTYRAEELATPQAFARDPKLVWEWYNYRREMVRSHQPNAGHFALAELRERVGKLTLITQCVDGYHQRAGCEDTIALHGNILGNRCTVCGQEGESTSWREGLPYCTCGGLQRPSVVWFGESLPESALRQAHEAAETCEVFISIGTSALVYPAAQLPHIAARHGAYLVEVNTEPTALTTSVDEFLQGPAGEVLPNLIHALKKVSS